MIKKRYILVIGILFVTTLSGSVQSEFILGQFWSKLDNTIVLTNYTDNVNIGQNETTDYKLQVNGTSYFNDTIYITSSSFPLSSELLTLKGNMLCDGTIIFPTISNQIKIVQTMGLGSTTINIPVTSRIDQIDFPTGSYTVVATEGTQSINGLKSFSYGNTYFKEKISHQNDPDTFIKFIDYDALDIYVGGKTFVAMSESISPISTLVINPIGQQIDFIVGGTISASLLKTDSINNRVGINTFIPTKTLDITGTLGVSSRANFNDLVLPINQPALPENGSCWYNCTTSTLCIYNGTTWRYI